MYAFNSVTYLHVRIKYHSYLIDSYLFFAINLKNFDLNHLIYHYQIDKLRILEYFLNVLYIIIN